MQSPEQWQPNIATTKAQVSGHRFFLRRAALGLVIGDERLIHDPLTRRNRATVVGFIAVVLLLLGAGLLAVVRPQPALGDSPLIQDDYGQLYVYFEDAWHPVANLTSARLLLEQAQEPTPVSSQVLAELDMAPPVGIPDAPQIFSTPDAVAVPAHHWLGCVQQRAHHPRHADAAEAVLLGTAATAVGTGLAADQAIVVPSPQGEYLITRDDSKDATSGVIRRLLPAASEPRGLLLREHLGITNQTPRWIVPPALLSAIPEAPAFRWPAAGELHTQGERAWLVHDDQAQLLTALQYELLVQDGAYPTHRLRGTPWSQLVATLVALPERAWESVHTAGDTWCIQATPTPATQESVTDFLAGGAPAQVDFQMDMVRMDADPARTQVSTLQLTQPDSAAALPLFYFHHDTTDTAAGSVTRLALTASGYHIVGETGVRHRITDIDTIATLGVTTATVLPWEFLQFLPQGTELSAHQAGQAAHEATEHTGRSAQQ